MLPDVPGSRELTHKLRRRFCTFSRIGIEEGKFQIQGGRKEKFRFSAIQCSVEIASHETFFLFQVKNKDSKNMKHEA